MRQSFRDLESEGKTADSQPSVTIGREASGSFRAFEFVAISSDTGVAAKTGMRAQQFEISENDALEFLLYFEIFAELDQVLVGRTHPERLSVIMDRMEPMSKNLSFCRVATMNSDWTTRFMRGSGPVLGF